MYDDLKEYSGTLWGVVRVAEELAAKARVEGLSEIEANFTLGGGQITIRMKTRSVAKQEKPR